MALPAATELPFSGSAGTLQLAAKLLADPDPVKHALAAELLQPEDCDNAFVAGVFSLLDVMLGVSLEQAFESVALPQPVVDAVLHGKGVLAPFLELTCACESADEEAFARCAQALHLSNRQVNWAHLQALAWAENLDQDE